MPQTDPPLRICFIAPAANVHTHRWVNAMANRGHACLVISNEPAEGMRATLLNPYHNIGAAARIPFLRRLLTERVVRRRVADFQPDVIHMHWLLPNASYMRLARLSDRFMISVWGSDVVWDRPQPQPEPMRRLKSELLTAACEVTATSEFLARETRDVYAPDRNVTVLPWGIDCSRFAPGDEPGNSDAPIIGYLKHYLSRYGPDVFLNAVPLVRRRHASACFEMYGTGSSDEVRALAARLKIGDAVRIEPPIPHAEVPAKLRSFYAYVMPSRSESFGVAALEASACGVPIVATRIGGIPEVVDDGTTGLLVPPDDPATLADAICRLLDDRALHARMRAAGPQFVRERYQWHDSVSRMESIYRRIAATAAPRTPPNDGV